MQDELPKIDGCKPVKKARPDGRVDVLWYHRKSGVRLPDDPKSLPFKLMVERLNGEEARKAVATVETIGSLILQYQASSDWKDLAESTRASEVFNIAAIEEEFGALPLTAVEEKGSRSMFLEWHEELAEDHPRAADMKLGRLQRIFKWAFDREKIMRHPLATFKRAYKSSRADRIWLPEHFEALNAKAMPAMKWAAFLALHTGQRRGDLIAMRWAQYDGTGISVRQSKTGAEVYIPCTKALRAELDARKAALGDKMPGVDLGAFPVVLSSRGDPYTANGFRLAWQHAFGASGIKDDLHFHDIRGTTVTLLAEGGATVAEIATITGHTLASVHRILERYLSRTKVLATSAISKLEERMGRAS